MQVQMGNATPHAHIVDHDDPCEYTWRDNGGGYTHVIEARPNGRDALLHVLTQQPIHLPDHECFVSIVSDWPNHSGANPTFVHAEDDERPDAAADLADMLSEAYDIPVGRPDDIEDTHHTLAGPPGVGPTTEG